MVKKLETVSTTVPKEIEIVANEIQSLNLNLDLGRQDLNDNFHKIQEKINELIGKK